MIASVLFSVLLSSAKELPTSLEELPAQKNLPDLFKFEDGKKVKNLDDWKERRKEIIEPLMFYQYGSIPPRPATTSLALQPHTSSLSCRKVCLIR